MKEGTEYWYLENVNFMDLFCKDLVKEKMDSFPEKVYNKGEFVYFVDDPSTHIYIVKTGRVKIGSYTNDGKEVVKNILSPGQIFGELALAEESQRRDFAIALDSGTAICTLTIEDMRSLRRMIRS